MSGSLIVHQAGPALSVQDFGRPGYMAFGLSQGGAADRLALAEGAALLGQGPELAALEMAGVGGTFEASQDIRIALTGAPMTASVDGQPLVWNATQTVRAGQRISIGAALKGIYGYLHIGGGIATPQQLGSRSHHIVAGIGAPIKPGMNLPIGADPNFERPDQRLPVSDRFSGGTLRVLPSAQTHRFSKAEITRFESTEFIRTPRGNRQGVQLGFDGAPFSTEQQLSILSEIMVTGDIQMIGEGIPFVLLPECQTTGGYPRIGTVVPGDLPLVAQATPGTRLRFRFVTVEAALETSASSAQVQSDLKRAMQPLIRDPREIRDLLSYQLIGGVTAGMELGADDD
ncbi:MAG: urea amidolyase [Marinosulfonomonas sp.]|nr:urea amidolyase [Marinosulfonomonas sp.]